MSLRKGSREKQGNGSRDDLQSKSWKNAYDQIKKVSSTLGFTVKIYGVSI